MARLSLNSLQHAFDSGFQLFHTTLKSPLPPFAKGAEGDHHPCLVTERSRLLVAQFSRLQFRQLPDHAGQGDNFVVLPAEVKFPRYGLPNLINKLPSFATLRYRCRGIFALLSLAPCQDENKRICTVLRVLIFSCCRAKQRNDGFIFKEQMDSWISRLIRPRLSRP
jgi:hypothetical protein